MSLLIKGLGLFNDAYQLFVMNIVNVVLSQRYKHYNDYEATIISTSVFIGSVLGQIVIGAYADKLGRKKLMIISCSLLIIGGILCSVSFGPNFESFIWILAVSRFILGVGIGGEYPLAATASSEKKVANPKERGPNVALVFSLQGLGQLLAALCGFFLILGLARRQHNHSYNNEHLDLVWRLLFGIGALPAIFIFYFRLKAEESSSYTQSQEKIKLLTGGLTLTNKDRLYILYKYYFKILFGTSISWFLFDVVFYAQGIFSDTVMSTVGANDHLFEVSIKNVCLAIGALPGYYVAVFTINKIGRQRMQLQGFVNMAIIFFIMGIFFNEIKHNTVLFVILYSLTFFFANFGPNTSTFVLPVEVFPTQIRATAHGIAAASGKIGAVVGSSLFTLAQNLTGYKGVFIICGIISVLGAILTFWFVYDGPEDIAVLDDNFSKILQTENKYKPLVDYTDGTFMVNETQETPLSQKIPNYGDSMDKSTHGSMQSNV